MKYNFFAMLSRMKYINRWGLMRNTRLENIAEHSLDVSIIAHALAIIKNTYFDGKTDPDHVAVLAMFHDTTEIITGDLPTPIKYYAPDIKNAYKDIEKTAADQLIDELPEEMKELYSGIMHENEDDYNFKIVKAADKISAIIKCIEERRMGNMDFAEAEKTLTQYVENMHMPEADYFLENFLPAYSLTLDEQT